MTDHSVGYFSSYDRGLECLLDMWPAIKKQVPDATLDIYYGWTAFDHVHSKNPQMMKWKWQMIRKMADVGAVEHGRVSHKELAKVMKRTKVWAYPTEFTEIYCITAVKANEAECIPVTTLCYALEETVSNKVFSVRCTDIYTNKAKQKQFIANVVLALKAMMSPAPQIYNAYWPDVAGLWDKALQPVKEKVKV